MYVFTINGCVFSILWYIPLSGVADVYASLLHCMHMHCPFRVQHWYCYGNGTTPTCKHLQTPDNITDTGY